MTRQFRGVDELREQFEPRRRAIHRRLEDFANVKPDEYFFELVYCLLTPQSSAVNAGKAVEKLRTIEHTWEESELKEILSRKEQYIRFHNTKANHLFRVRNQYPEILAKLTNLSSVQEMREWLVDNVKGLGLKEASHFLRNIGYREMAILDRHILRNLLKYNVIRTLPKTLTAKHYLMIEKKFRHFAAAIGISLDELDLLFWSNETGEILK